ncbi:hypothetical protein FJZ31_18670 [Candidatus Poribacteria bacterium]|nr:hypothetical protein [Candidatus Poribacteria bacterium]
MYEMKDFPLSIQELLKKRGWTWPPDEKLKKKMNEAAKRAAGSVHVEPDLLRDLFRDRGIDYGDEVWEKHKKKRRFDIECGNQIREEW